MAIRKKHKNLGEKENILNLKDLDPQTCKELGGKRIDNKCFAVKSGVDEAGEVHLKVLKDSETG